jgi:hypothetical protein
MNLHSNRRIMVFSLAVASTTAGVVAACLVACSSGSSSNSFTGGDDDGSVNTQGGGCSNPTVPIVFSPMFSAYIPGSTAQTFQIPVITGDGNMATWSLSDPSQGNLQPQSFMSGDSTVPGVMITLSGTGKGGGADASGTVTVYAKESSGACGSAVLNITTNSENDWTIGSARYNDGVSLHVGPPAGFDGGFMHHDGGFPGFDGGIPGFEGGMPHTSDGGSFFEVDGGTACTNCHGATGDTVFKDVSHTPEQTGGFSDTDLQNIILNGEVPDGGYFDPTVINPACDGGAACTQAAYKEWHNFHQWVDITSDQLPGVICYLRSLAPAPQNGSSNFGGGGHHHDGGFGGGPPAMDAGMGGGG